MFALSITVSIFTVTMQADYSSYYGSQLRNLSNKYFERAAL